MKYTKSAFCDTADFIKTIIYILDVLIQIGYIGYLTYRICHGTGFLITNLILLVISSIYLIYYFATTREFYTVDEVETKKAVKLIFKVLKRIVNTIVIGLSIYQLAVKQDISNIDLLITFVMILGLILSILGDLFSSTIFLI